MFLKTSLLNNWTILLCKNDALFLWICLWKAAEELCVEQLRNVVTFSPPSFPSIGSCMATLDERNLNRSEIPNTASWPRSTCLQCMLHHVTTREPVKAVYCNCVVWKGAGDIMFYIFSKKVKVALWHRSHEKTKAIPCCKLQKDETTSCYITSE